MWKKKLCVSILLFQKNISLAVRRLAGFLTVRRIGERAFTELVGTWWTIALSLAGKYQHPFIYSITQTSGAFILSLLWILLMRYLSSLMVWLSILSVILCLGCLVSYSVYRLYQLTVSADPMAMNRDYRLGSVQVLHKRVMGGWPNLLTLLMVLWGGVRKLA